MTYHPEFARRVLRAALLMAVVTFQSRAQQADPAAVSSFEVASIKVSNPEPGRPSISIAGRTFTTSSFTLKALIRLAYDVPGFNIAGGPAWINSERYDITAKAEPHYGNLT